MMRRQIAGLLAACLLLPLPACGPAETQAETDWTVEQMAQAIRASQPGETGMTAVLPGDELYETYLTDSYGLDAADVADGAILAAGGTSAQEVAVFRLAEDASAGEVSETLRTYLEERTGAFTGYLPEEAALLENAEVEVRGNYVALLACPDIPEAREAFDRCFTEDPPAVESPEQQVLSPVEASAVPAETGTPSAQPIPEETAPAAQTPAAESRSPTPTPAQAAAAEPSSQTAPAPAETPWSYDEARLLDAWAAGDWSGLAGEDRAILDTCAQVIASVAPEGLSDYEKELAIHDWMIAWGSYDSNTLSQLPDFQENPNNDNPYGFLVDGRGICLGYATTFQLFMDLLGIECITVEGAAYSYTADHAWNQVRLDGEWYCVDVTWDDPTTRGAVSERTAHRYFNVTSDFMRDTDHQWDETSTPEAEGTAYAWEAGR